MTDITLDRNVMRWLVLGNLAGTEGVTEEARCARVSAWFVWRGASLHVAGKDGRRVPPICERKGLVEEAALQLGLPGGDRLYQLLRTRYYWSGMRRDCVTVCA